MAHNASAPPTDPLPPVLISATTKYLRAGQVVAERYEVRERLGAGGMGTVYRVFDRLLSEEVALKILNLDSAPDARSLGSLRHETRLARKISHPNVCRVFDLGLASDIVFLTMELLPGETLRTRIARNTEPLAERLKLFEHIARGLAAVHARGILHRDLKPENVLLRADGTAVVADFGLAMVTDESKTPAVVAGTPLYMSPEQLRGEVLDVRSDIFALGLIGYELLTGKRPFGDGSRSAVKKEPPPRPVIPSLDMQIAKVMVDLLMLAIAEAPANRCSSAATMADTIAAVRAAVVGKLVTADKTPGRRAVPPEMTMLATGEAAMGRKRWFALHPTTGFVLLAVLSSRLLDTTTLGASDDPTDTRRSTSANESSRATAVFRSNLWRAGELIDNFSWNQRMPRSPRNQLMLLGARRLGGERIPYVNALAVDNRGFLYVAGAIFNVPVFYRAPLESTGGQTIYVAQLSPTGAQQWARQYKSYGSDHINAMKIGADGNLYIAGQFEGVVDFGGETLSSRSSAGNTDAYVASYSASGEYRWAHDFGDTGLDAANAIALDASDNVTVVGSLGEAERLDQLRPRKKMLLPSMTYVESRDKNGELRWPIRRYYGGDVSAVVSGRDGEMYLAGSLIPDLVLGEDSMMTSNGAGDFLARLGANGKCQWSHQLGGQSNDIVRNIALDLKGNSYVAGAIYLPPNRLSTEPRITKTRYAYVASFTPLGDSRWSHMFGSRGDDARVAMAVSSSEDILVAAVVKGTVILNGKTFEVGTRTGTIIALFAASGELRDAMLLRNCRISEITIASNARNEAYAAGELEGTLDWGTDSITSVGDNNEILLKIAF